MKNNLPFTLWGAPVLHTPTKLVKKSEVNSAQLKKFFKKAFGLLKKYESPGIAANQLGIGKRFIVVWVRPTKRYPKFAYGMKGALINARITKRSKEKIYLWEGCLSFGIPGFERNPRFYLERNKWVEVEYLDENWEKIKKRFEGVEGIVMQHEIDHLDGRVCAERLVTRGGRVLPGAISTDKWFKETKGAPPAVNPLNPPKGLKK